MFLNKDQISEAAKSNLEAQFALYSEFAGKTLENFEKLITLNLTAARASMDEATSSSKQLLAAKDPQEFMTLLAGQARPNLDKAVSYGSHVANIAVAMQTQFGRLAEAQISGFSQRVSGIVEEASRNAPAGSENMAAFIKSALDKVNSGYEQFSRNSKQAAEVFGANVTAASAPAATVAASAKV